MSAQNEAIAEQLKSNGNVLIETIREYGETLPITLDIPQEVVSAVNLIETDPLNYPQFFRSKDEAVAGVLAATNLLTQFIKDNGAKRDVQLDFGEKTQHQETEEESQLAAAADAKIKQLKDAQQRRSVPEDSEFPPHVATAVRYMDLGPGFATALFGYKAAVNRFIESGDIVLGYLNTFPEKTADEIAASQKARAQETLQALLGQLMGGGVGVSIVDDSDDKPTLQ